MQARGNLARQALQQDPLVFTIDLSGGGRSHKGTMSIPANGETWTELKVKEIILASVGIVMNQQAALDNPVLQTFVDGTPFKAFDQFQRNITLLFNQGNNVRPVMTALEMEVRRRIPGTSWRWKVAATDAARQRMLNSALVGRGPVLLGFGEQLLYVPTRFSGYPDPTYGNVLYKQGRRPDGAGKTKRRGTKTGRTGGKGWYGLTATAIRGIGKKQGVYVKAIHSLKYVPEGRKLPPGAVVGQKVGNSYYQGSWAFVLKLQFGSKGRR